MYSHLRRARLIFPPMQRLQNVDTGLFRFINQTLSNRFFDAVMPCASGQNVGFIFFPLVLLGAIWLVWKGGARGRLCVLMLALILWPGDSFICATIKKAVARPRPFFDLPDARVLLGRGGSGSMPSSHAANWFAATMILFFYYRRTILFMLPAACVVSFSRVYNGVHYPSDVLAGAALGAGYAAAGVVILNSLWQCAGRRWFPLWWRALPSLVPPRTTPAETEDESPPESETAHAGPDLHWLRLGWILIALLLAGRLAYVAGGRIELTGDEAYYWLWSKHPALSYSSKPPLIAYTIRLGTALWGDNAFGVRFFAPVIAALLSFLVLRFIAREGNARAGFMLLLALTAAPLFGVGSILMTIDPLSVLFWTAAMFAGWRAIQPQSKTVDWFWVGLWMGLGFLSKYTELFQWLCWAVFFALWKPARAHLRKPGPWLALLVNLLCTVPVLIWNSQHGWVTVHHVANQNAHLNTPWTPSLSYFTDFLAAEAALLNPVFFVATIWAAVAFWRRGGHNPRLVYLFSMGAPVFLAYALFTIHSRVEANWIAPSVIPLFCLAAIYWDTRWRLGARAIKGWLIAGLAIGLPIVALAHETELIRRIAGHPLPPERDPLHRVRGFISIADIVGQARADLLAQGKPVFIICSHYSMASLITFYLPEARAGLPDHPIVFTGPPGQHDNQFALWPGYAELCAGQNALFVREADGPVLVKGWQRKWLAGDTNLWTAPPPPEAAPKWLVSEFASVTDLGVRPALYRDRVFHTIQLFECRDLR